MKFTSETELSVVRKLKPEPVAVVIKRLITDLGLKKRYNQERIIQRWPEIVGETIACRAKATRIENGKLYVSVDRPTWRNELILRKKDILGRINSLMKHDVVKDIIFR